MSRQIAALRVGGVCPHFKLDVHVVQVRAATQKNKRVHFHMSRGHFVSVCMVWDEPHRKVDAQVAPSDAETIPGSIVGSANVEPEQAIATHC